MITICQIETTFNLQADSLLLGGDDVLPGGGLLLHRLLALDLQKIGRHTFCCKNRFLSQNLGKAGVNFVLPDGLQGSFFLIKLLVDP